ncbi:2-pyrone-4,6-dicarboxylate lactonase [Variovorax boronicumulans]|uniref:amidohydrolase family protein n=1 Tax=Variovorax boronicumulans TaxID=436515 RepID=UPI0033935824
MSTAIADATDPVRTYLEHPSAPRLQLPALSCDSHVHVFGPVARFPYAADRRATPLEAPKEKLFALHRRMGIERCVIVQSIVHGTDNRVVEDAIAAGEGRYLGIALFEPDVPDAELQRLAQVGFRGVRFNFMRHIAHGANIDAVMRLTPRLAAVGMHLQVHFESELVHELSGPLQCSQVPVVIDHMGRVDATRGPDHADFQALLRLLDNPRFYVKVSGIDRIDAKAPPEARYQHGVVLARALVERFADRCVWGSDWPHPNHTHIPDDGVLVDRLAEIAPSPDLLEQLLVRNPAALYKFLTP